MPCEKFIEYSYIKQPYKKRGSLNVFLELEGIFIFSIELLFKTNNPLNPRVRNRKQKPKLMAIDKQQMHIEKRGNQK